MSDEQSPEPVTLVPSPVRLDYTVTAGRNLTRYLNGLAEKRILGTRCGDRVYVPPRDFDPTTGEPSHGEIEVKHTGTVTTFCIIRIPFEAAAFPPPYAAAAILLDGADIPIFHLIRGIDVSEVRMGMRVRAEWVPDDELGPTLASIKWFEPTGEPDADYETYREHL